jgi:hypothetical protein
MKVSMTGEILSEVERRAWSAFKQQPEISLETSRQKIMIC